MSQQSPEEHTPEQPEQSEQPARSIPSERKSDGGFAQIAQEMAAKNPLARKENGHIDLLAAAGGMRGIAESVLPGLVFLVAFTLTRYGGLFEDGSDAAVDRLDELLGERQRSGRTISLRTAES